MKYQVLQESRIRISLLFHRMELKWKLHSPTWLKKKYDGYDDEIWVKFWKKEWQEIIYSGGDSYTQRILSSGFNGVYLDNVEAYYFLYFD